MTGRRAREMRVVAAGALLAAATVAYGLYRHATDGVFGTASPPFVFNWWPRVEHAALPLLAAALVAAAAWATPRLVRLRSPAAFVAAASGVTLALGLAVNAVPSGVAGWWAVFELGPGGSFEAANEYLPGLPALSYGAEFFLDRFAELVPSLPVNVAGHPPALMLIIHWTGIDGAQELAALCIAALVAVTPATYVLARVAGLADGGARRAALLAAASPMLLLYGITSADAVYALVGTVTAALLAARRTRPLGCLALAGAAFFSWALLAVGAWGAIWTWRREGWRSAVALAGGCAGAVLAFDAALAAAFGYDAIGALRATEAYYRNSVASQRPYAFWAFGSPVAFAVTAGLPTAAAWLVALVRRDAAALALAVVVGLAAVLGFTKAEVERIWLPFVPLLCVAAAGVVSERRLRAVVALLGAQALITSLLWDTIW